MRVQPVSKESKSELKVDGKAVLKEALGGENPLTRSKSLIRDKNMVQILDQRIQ